MTEKPRSQTELLAGIEMASLIALFKLSVILNLILSNKIDPQNFSALILLSSVHRGFSMIVLTRTGNTSVDSKSGPNPK